MEDYTTMKSYQRYMGLLNKVCGSVLFLVLAVLTTTFSILTFGNLSRDSAGEFAVLLYFLPAVFSTLTSIGLWILFFAARKNKITGKKFGLVKAFPKFRQIMRVLCAIVVIVVVILLTVLMVGIQTTINTAASEVSILFEEIEETLTEFGLSAQQLSIVTDLLKSASFIFAAGEVLVVFLGAVTVAIMILEAIRYSRLCRLLSIGKKLKKSGKMRMPSTGFYVTCSYVFAVVLFIWNLGFLPFSSFTLSGFVYPAMMVISAIIVKKSSKELNLIYSEWQEESANLK